METELYQKVNDDVGNDIDKFENENDIRRIKRLSKVKKIDKVRKLRQKTYSRDFNSKFKKKIMQRDKECLLCKGKEDLVVHHITYNRRKTSEEECVTLCRKCNLRVNKKSQREYWQNYFNNLLYYKLNR